MSTKPDRRAQIQEDIRRDLARRRREAVLIVVFGLVFALVFYLQFRFSKIAEDRQPFDLSTGLTDPAKTTIHPPRFDPLSGPTGQCPPAADSVRPGRKKRLLPTLFSSRQENSYKDKYL